MTAYIQPSFAAGELSPSLYARVDIAKYPIGLRKAYNVFVHTQGGVSNRAGLEWIGYCGQHTAAPRLVPFEYRTSDTYMLEFGAQYLRVIRNGGYVLDTGETITGATQANPCVLSITGTTLVNGDDIFVAGAGGMTDLNGRWFKVANKATNSIELTDPVSGADIDSTNFDAFTSGGTASKIYEIATPYVQDDLATLKYVQSADVMTLVHPNYDVRELARTDHDAWALTTVAFAPGIDAPAGQSVTVVGTTGSTTYNYKITAIAEETFEESLPSAIATTATGNANLSSTDFNQPTWSAVTGAEKYDVYKEENGLYGYIGSTEDLSFDDTNFAPDLAITPPKARDPFSTSGTEPGAVSYYKQRRVFGGSTDKPDTNYFSVTGAYSNMSVSSPSQENDAITATLTARKVSEIRHYVPLKDLLVLTSGAEWSLNSGPDSSFSINTLKQEPQSYWGCSHVVPLVIGRDVLFTQESGEYILSTGYVLEFDGYDGPDMTILSRHLFEGYVIQDASYAQIPYSTAHYVRSDGHALCLTFNRRQEVTAWTEWETQGNFKRCATIPETVNGRRESVTYWVVERTVNGNQAYFVERGHSRKFDDIADAFFVDCGVSYDNPVTITGATQADPVVITAVGHPFANAASVDITNMVGMTELNGLRFSVANATADTFELVGVDGTEYSAYSSGGEAREALIELPGYDHLEGETLVGLSDGNVVRNVTVSGGKITLPRAASRAHFGMAFTADIETLNVEAPDATIQGKFKKISSVTVRFERSRGLFIGHDTSDLVEMKQREFEPYGAPTALLTGDKKITLQPKWDVNGRVYARQADPLPMTILAVVPDMVVGG